MKTRRGSLLWSGTHGDAILMYKPGDVVKPVTVMDQFFTGVVRNVDTKTNKITVAWGGGPESQHDVDEIMPMPFFDGQKNKDAIKTSSCRRMRADASDIVDAPEIGVETSNFPPESSVQTDFVPEDMEGLLNRQVGCEFYSAYLYYMAAAIFQSKGLVGFQNWMEKQGDGEIDHAMKVYNYLVDTGSALILPAIPGPALDAGMEVAELTRLVLDHEMGVTQDWKRIGQLSKLQDNPATCKLVQEFMCEQVEEEDAALTLHQKVQMADSGSGLLMIDNDLRDRSPIAASEKVALNPPDEQYCGEFPTHGLDEPRGGGFSIMKDLAYDLHDEANDFADVNPRIASIKAGLKEIAHDSDMTSSDEVFQFIAKSLAATGSDEPPAQRTWEEETAKKSSVSITADWMGPKPVECDFCHKKVESGYFVDGATDQGPWGLMCSHCFSMHGVGIGQGRGQKYDAKSGRKLQGSDHTASECGCLGLDGLRSRRAMYWCAPDRTFRLTLQEQQNGTATCPKCRVEMSREKFTRSDKLLMCPTCGFKVPTSKAVTKPQVEIKVPDGVNVQVTHQDECGEDVCGEMINGSRRGKTAYADPKELADLPRMSLSQIAMIVYKDWKAVNYAAKPYLQAMSSLQNVSDMYGMDSGSSVVAYFLSNATSWKGDVAKAVKKELNRRIR